MFKEGFNINTYFKKLGDSVDRLGFDEKLVFFNVIFIFVPIFVSALTTLVLAIYILTKPKNRRSIASVPFAFILAIWAVLSLVAGLIHLNFLGDAAFLVYISFVLFGLFTFTVMTENLAKSLIQLMSALCIAAFAVAVAVKLIFHTARSASTFYNPNYYGFVCELIILVSVYGLFSFKTHRLLYLASIASGFGGILLSGCRSAWLAVIGGTIIILFGLKKYKWLIAVIAASGAGALIIKFFPSIIPRSTSLDTTTSLRMEIWKIAYAGFLKFPAIGQGFMGYWLLSHGKGRADLPHAHDIVLNALDSYGAIGVILLAIFIIPAVIILIKKFRVRPIFALVLGVVVAIFIHGVTDDPILGMQTGILSMTIIAIAGAKPVKRTELGSGSNLKE